MCVRVTAFCMTNVPVRAWVCVYCRPELPKTNSAARPMNIKACVCVGLGSLLMTAEGERWIDLAVYTEPGPGRGEWQSSVCVCVVCVSPCACLLFGLRDWSPASIYRSIIHPLLISPSSPDEKRTITRATGPQTHTQIHTKAKANRRCAGRIR